MRKNQTVILFSINKLYHRATNKGTFFMDFQLIDAERMVVLECYHFATLNEIKDLDNYNQGC